LDTETLRVDSKAAQRIYSWRCRIHGVPHPENSEGRLAETVQGDEKGEEGNRRDEILHQVAELFIGFPLTPREVTHPTSAANGTNGADGDEGGEGKGGGRFGEEVDGMGGAGVGVSMGGVAGLGRDGSVETAGLERRPAEEVMEALRMLGE
jgi:hypothetical protein